MRCDSVEHPEEKEEQLCSKKTLRVELYEARGSTDNNNRGEELLEFITADKDTDMYHSSRCND